MGGPAGARFGCLQRDEGEDSAVARPSRKQIAVGDLVR